MKKLIFTLSILFSLGLQGQLLIPMRDSTEWVKFDMIAESNHSWIFLFFNDNSNLESKELLKSDYFQNFEKVFDKDGIPLLVNLEVKNLAVWSRHFNITSTPTLIFLKNHTIYHRLEGYPTESFEAIFQTAQENFKNIPQYKKAFDGESISKENLMSLVYFEYHNRNYKALNYLVPAMELKIKDEDLKDTLFWDYFNDFGLDMNSALFQTIRDYPELLITEKDTFPFVDFAERAVAFNSSAFAGGLDSSNIPLIESEIIFPLVSDSTNAKYLSLELWQEFLASKKRWSTYQKLTESFLKNHPNSDLICKEVDKALAINYDYYSSEAMVWLEWGLQKKKTTSLYIRKAYLELNKGNFQDAFESAKLAIDYANTEEEKTEAIQFFNHMTGGGY